MREPLGLALDSVLACRPMVTPDLFADTVNYHHFLYVLQIFCDASSVDVYSSQSYIVLSTAMHDYVIGIASDGKLFVNKIRREPFGRLVKVIEDNRRKIHIHTSEDEAVWRILGYDYDAEAEEVVIGKTGTYRIQGDLLMEVEEYKPSDILMRLANAQARLLLDTVARVLTELRISVDSVDLDANRLRVPFSFPISRGAYTSSSKALDDVRQAVIEKLAKILYERMRTLNLATSFTHLGWNAFIRGDGDFKNCDIRVTDSGFLVNYDVTRYASFAIALSATCNLEHGEGTLLEKLHNGFQEHYKPRSFEFIVGNHHVRLENARSMAVRYRPKYQPLLLGDIVVEIGGGSWYHVSPNTVVTIVHDEHGITTIRFNDEYLIRFRTIEFATSHFHERNAIVLNMLT